MTYRANPLLKKLDNAAEMTGFPAFSRRARQHATLPFRILPVLNLAFGVGGLFAQIWAPTGGWVVLMCLWTTGFALQAAGLMRPPPGGIHDERERALIRVGHFGGLAAVAVLAISGCFLAGFASALSLLGWAAPPWTPSRIQDWIALGFFLLVVEQNVAILVISWKLPWRMPVEEED